MNRSLTASWRATARVGRVAAVAGSRPAAVAGRRCFAGSAAQRSAADTTLPLQGYRVLDMTRVLAGVRHVFTLTVTGPFATTLTFIFVFILALLHPNIRRSRVSWLNPQLVRHKTIVLNLIAAQKSSKSSIPQEVMTHELGARPTPSISRILRIKGLASRPIF